MSNTKREKRSAAKPPMPELDTSHTDDDIADMESALGRRLTPSGRMLLAGILTEYCCNRRIYGLHYGAQLKPITLSIKKLAKAAAKARSNLSGIPASPEVLAHLDAYVRPAIELNLPDHSSRAMRRVQLVQNILEDLENAASAFTTNRTRADVRRDYALALAFHRIALVFRLATGRKPTRSNRNKDGKVLKTPWRQFADAFFAPLSDREVTDTVFERQTRELSAELPKKPPHHSPYTYETFTRPPIYGTLFVS